MGTKRPRHRRHSTHRRRKSSSVSSTTSSSSYRTSSSSYTSSSSTSTSSSSSSSNASTASSSSTSGSSSSEYETRKRTKAAKRPRISKEIKSKKAPVPILKERFEEPPVTSKHSKLRSEESDQFASKESSLSIEETNKLRAQLGLKPLNLSKESTTSAPDVHKPAVNIAEEKQSEVLREKISTSREKRELTEKYRKIRTLGQDDEDLSTQEWVEKQKRKDNERVEAEKREKLLKEMDHVFGVENLIRSELKPELPGKHYSSEDLEGLKIEHEEKEFSEGRTIILTLKDSNVLDDADDVLVNVNMVDNEKARDNVELSKKKPLYNPYDTDDVNEYGFIKPKEILSKYNEEIEGKKAASFTLGKRGVYDAEKEKTMNKIKEELMSKAQNLKSDLLKPATDYYTQEELVKFKKPKKLKKVVRRKALKVDDILPLESEGDKKFADHGSRQKLAEAIKVEHKVENEEDNIDDVSEEALKELQNVGPLIDEFDVDLSKLSKKPSVKPLNEVAAKIINQRNKDEENSQITKMTFDSMSEFCRTLGDLPTYGLAGNREEERDAIMDLELERLAESRRKASSALNTDEELSTEHIDSTVSNRPINSDDNIILDEEPCITAGLYGAIKLAENKGYLDKHKIRQNARISKQNISAVHYTIEEKSIYDIDDKFSRKERYCGPLTEFKEKDGYRPNVSLEYLGEAGRKMSQKEAFRYLSHRFHGKGSGKKKTEKRMAKLKEEDLMKKMSSIDTPLNTVSLLHEKQKELNQPYITLSSSRKDPFQSLRKV